MTRARWVWVCTGILSVAAAVGTAMAARGVEPAPAGAALLVSAHDQTPAAKSARTSSAPATQDYNDLISTYCGDCHNKEMKRGEVSFDTFDIAKAGEAPELTERMIRKLQAGMMPPPGEERPDAVTLRGAHRGARSESGCRGRAAAESRRAHVPAPESPRVPARGQGAARDLTWTPGQWLPLDQKSANFDNIADEQTLSATLLESYLNAAGDISRMAVGDRHGADGRSHLHQHELRCRSIRGITSTARRTARAAAWSSSTSSRPMASTSFEVTFTGGDNSRFEDIDISLNGERIALVRYETGQAGAADGRGAVPMRTEPILIKAGQHLLSAAFVRRFDGPYEDLIRPHDWSFAGGGSGGAGITTLPHLRDVIIHGPFRPTGISDTPSRKKIFTCRPTGAADERACARTIVTKLGGEAYRRPLAARDVDAIMKFYDEGAAKGGFESGVRTALEAMLASPHFIFRLERQPENVKPGTIYRVDDFDLASRLSFFLWGAPPDQELLAAAGRGELGDDRGPRTAGAPDARRPALRRAGLALRRAVAAPAGHRQGSPGSELLSELRRPARGPDAPRDRVVLQLPRARRPQRARPATAPTTRS